MIKIPSNVVISFESAKEFFKKNSFGMWNVES